MRCKNCGAKLPDDEKFCMYCGSKLYKSETKTIYQSDEYPQNEKKMSEQYSDINENKQNELSDSTNQKRGYILGIVAIIVAFFSPIIAIICGSIGLSQAKDDYRKGITKNKSIINLNMTAMIIAGIVFFISEFVLSLNDWMWGFE